MATKELLLEKINGANFSTPVPVTVDDEEGGEDSRFMIATFTMSDRTSDFTCNKSLTEIIGAMSNGIIVIPRFVAVMQDTARTYSNGQLMVVTQLGNNMGIAFTADGTKYICNSVVSQGDEYLWKLQEA